MTPDRFSYILCSLSGIGSEVGLKLLSLLSLENVALHVEYTDASWDAEWLCIF